MPDGALEFFRSLAGSGRSHVVQGAPTAYRAMLTEVGAPEGWLVRASGWTLLR
ncbi:hypothetical protein GCM10010446_63560 [Streptomyces enissocaesilis]|uniref:Uncharacterized protein n=2 Tax=Streptomyces enissocaesilis TaxID=332589 RepID=A0ABN3XP32_9ACTN